MNQLRRDPITRRWVIISTQRGKRPHDFKFDTVKKRVGICPFDPGNEHLAPPEVFAIRPDNSPPNTPGWSLRVVPNKFPALIMECEPNRRAMGLYDVMDGFGTHEVIIETPHHEETFDMMSTDKVLEIVKAYRERIRTLKKDRRIKYVLVFKNYGPQAGASLEHSHSQLVALPVIPKRIQEKIDASKMHFQYRERCLLCDIVDQELQETKRLIDENDEFVAFEPFASRFPFETWIVPKKHQTHFEDADEDLYLQFARILRDTIRRLTEVLDRPPYNFMILNAPFVHSHDEYFHWHLEIIPRLTRIAGFEWGSDFYINPTPPELAAEYLKENQAKESD